MDIDQKFVGFSRIDGQGIYIPYKLYDMLNERDIDAILHLYPKYIRDQIIYQYLILLNE